jgi:putative tryptophan/tyrosine transport system substrate-binding protein
MRRREFITLVGGAVVTVPLATRAQQPPMPVIGFLHPTSLETKHLYLAAFHRGLGEAGYVEGRNVAVDYRWGQGQNDRLPTLVAELVRLQVSVIVVVESTAGALAAKAATQTIPIVFMQGADPVRINLVSSLNHPGGNLTGINLFLAEVAAKRFELLLEMVPSAKSIGYLYNPTNPVFAETETREVQDAADTLGVRVLSVTASRLSEIETAFAHLVDQRADALFVSSDGFLLTQSGQIVALAASRHVPAIYGWREAGAVGGLMTYGTNFLNAWRQAGVYTGRILKVRSQAICRSRSQRTSSSPSTSRPQRRLALPCHPCCLRRPTRWSNEAARFHHGARWRDGMAACRARATEAGAQPRRAHEQQRR